MNFLLDESVDARIRVHLQKLGQDIVGIAKEYPASLSDIEVLAISCGTERILITSDSDFGRLVFVDGHPHVGVIYLRLGPSPPLATTTGRLDVVLSQHAHELHRFLVVTHNLIRIR